jgi:cellulose synthase operon protein C
MPTSPTNSLGSDQALESVPSPQGDGGGPLAWLRAELAATGDAARRARLLADLADAEERTGDQAAAVRDLLAAHEADPEFREPLESLASIVENDRALTGIDTIFDSLVDSSTSPDERVRGLLMRGRHHAERLGDINAALASARDAVTVEGAAPAERGSAFLALEAVAGRAGDSGARELGLAERAASARHPTWRALLLVDRARLAAARGDVDAALSLIGEAKAENSQATWAALVLEDEVLRDHPGIEGTAEARARAAQSALTHDAMATLVRTATADAAWGDALGVPGWVREPGRAVDLWLTAAGIQRDLGKLDEAGASLGLAQSIIETMGPPERSLADAISAHARIRLADRAGDAPLAAALAEGSLPGEVDGPNAAALALRVAEQAAATGDREKVLRALEQALRRDPTSLPARALQLDVLSDGDDMTAFAAQLEAAAEQLEGDDARAHAFLVAAFVWGAFANDPSSAKAALSQAAMFGASTQVIGYLARTLASLQGDAGWYEEATKRLFATRGNDATSLWLGLELFALRDARGDRDGAGKALRDLHETPGGAWAAGVLAAFSPVGRAPAVSPTSTEAPASGLSALQELAARESDAQWFTAASVAAAMRAHAHGDIASARRFLRDAAQRRPEDVSVASYLGRLDRDAGDHDAAAKTASDAAAAVSDPELAAAFFLESGLQKWRSEHREGAVASFERAVPNAPAAARLMLSWARWAAAPDNAESRRRAIDEALELRGGDRALSLERFATEIALGNADSAARALGDVDAEANDPLALAAALGRLAWSDAAVEPSALQRAVDIVAAQGPEGALIAAAERVRIAREAKDMERVAQEAGAWFRAGGALPAALEWIAAAVVLGDAREEMHARLAAASCLSGDARAALMARAALVHPRVDFDHHAPLVPGGSPIIRLANLDLSPPGSDPRRRAAVLTELGDVLGDDARIDARALSGWSLVAAGDVAGAQAAFEGVISIRPDDPAAWEGIRVCAEHTGDTALNARACAQLGAVCKDAKRGAAFWEQAAMGWIELGEDAEAERALDSSFSLDPTRGAAFDKLFRRLRDRKDHSKLLAVIARRLAVTDDPNEIQKLSWEQARALRESGDPEGALQALEHVTMLDPNHVGALALLGEINIRRGKFDDAATALTRLALLDGAPAKSRVTAGVAAVDLYENKLNRFDKSLDVLTSLHRAGISTLPVRERLARAAARGGAWREATAILEELMLERPDGTARAEAARLAMAIHRDRLGDSQQAAPAIVCLLDEAPSDPEGLAMLRQTSHPDDVRLRLLTGARTAIADHLQDQPTDAEAIRQLAAVGRDLGDSALERAALGALACLGASDPERAEALARLAAGAPHLAQIAISKPLLESILAPGDSGPIADLFALLGPTLADALGPNLQACGVGRRDKVDPRSGLSLRNEIASWAGAFGLAEIDVYVGGNDPLGIQGIAGDPPALVVGPSIKGPVSTLGRARVARELLAVVRGSTVVRWRDEVSISAIVVAACRLAEVPIDHPAYAVLAELERLIGKALPRRTRKAMNEVCRAVVASGVDARAWSRRAIASHDRMAALAGGDPVVVLADITGAPSDRLDSAIVGNPRAEELLRYVLSQSYLDARAALGLESTS